MLSKLKSFGPGAAVIIVPLLFIFVAFAFVKGASVAGAWAFPFLSSLASILTVFVLPLLVILAIVRPTRFIAASGFLLLSYVYGLTLWIWAFLMTFAVWGWFGVIVGLFLAGIGVVPIAMITALFHAEWSVFGQLVLGIVLTFGCRRVSAGLIAVIDAHSASITDPDI